MTIRLRLKWLLVIVAIGVIALISPYLYLIGFGFARGLDVSSAVSHVIAGQASGETTPEADVPYLNAPVVWNGLVQNQELNENSGMAWNDGAGIVWAHNDSGGKTRIYAMAPDGTDLGHVDIDIPEMGDWEDMARFTLEGESYLVIADFGDNFRWRPELYLFVIKEPTREMIENKAKVAPDWMIVYRYPEGYRDSEGIGVDAESGWIYLPSKRTVPAEMYRVPLQPANQMSLESDPLVAERVADLIGIPQPNAVDKAQDPKWGETRSMPTAMDMQADRAVIVTYKDAYLYQKAGQESWNETFSGIPQRIALPRTYGREATALSEDGKELLVAAERDGDDATNLYQVSLP